MSFRSLAAVAAGCFAESLEILDRVALPIGLSNLAARPVQFGRRHALWVAGQRLLPQVRISVGSTVDRKQVADTGEHQWRRAAHAGNCARPVDHAEIGEDVVLGVLRRGPCPWNTAPSLRGSRGLTERASNIPSG